MQEGETGPAEEIEDVAADEHVAADEDWSCDDVGTYEEVDAEECLDTGPFSPIPTPRVL